MISAYESRGLFFYPFISITPNYSTIFYRCENHNYHKVSDNSKNNLLSNKQFGFLSEISKTKIRKAVNLLLYISPDKYTGIVATKKDFKYKITFITLTLPAQQIHPDTEITQKCLHDFLNILRNNYGMQHYVWKAEKQKNGNIHYHITTNIYVHWSNVREEWIKCIKPLGYIETYQKNQNEYHCGGFKVRNELLHNWSYEAQKSAYEYGRKTNWQSPNCTDIHSVINIKDLAAYISEYFTKQPLEAEDLITYQNAINSIRQAERYIKIHTETLANPQELTENYINQIKEVIENNQIIISNQNIIIEKYKHLFIQGRVWFLSRSLSNVKVTLDLDNTIFAQEISNYCQANEKKVKHSDRFSVICANINELKTNGCTETFKEYNTSIWQQIETTETNQANSTVRAASRQANPEKKAR